MVIVDTTVWIDYFRGNASAESDWLDANLGRQTLAITDLILCEVLQGVLPESAVAKVHRELLKCIIFDTGGQGLAVATAANYRALRRHGRTVRKIVDCLIATFCIQNDHALLHRDRDFDHFVEFLDLKVIQP